LKKLSLELQPYHEAMRVIDETLEERPKKMQLDIRVLEHLISYSEHQFGARVPGRAYRERRDGDRIDNWTVEIGILIPIYSNLVSFNSIDESLSMIDIGNFKFPYYGKMLDLLRPWSPELGSNPISRIDSLDKDQINIVLCLLSTTERNIGTVLRLRTEFVLAESYCQQSLSHARLYEGTEEYKIDLVCNALKGMYGLRAFQDNFIDALPFAEEAYDLVAIAYNPVHPRVQEAAGTLIECLMHKGDLYNAERFAEAALDSLKDPANGLDQESEAAANGYYNLANVINKQEGDSVKAEMLARESLRIRTCVYGNDHIGLSCGLLARILMSQDNLGNETMELFERSLANDTKVFGPDGINTATSNFNLGAFYHRLADKQQNAQKRIEYLRLSKSIFKEALRLYSKIFGPNNPQTIEASSTLCIISRELSKA
jgi:tetratricopeptide (TPR) repeat protein